MRPIFLIGVLTIFVSSCQKTSPDDGANGGATPGGSGPTGGSGVVSGGAESAGGVGAASGSQAGAETGGGLPEPVPKYHPPAGFENCEHAEVKADCENGWCKLPPSCFVMGSPDSEWKRGRDDETQAAVILTHWIEIQQKEFTRAEWELITNVSPPGPENCTDPLCPVAMVSWWDAISLADMLSEQKKLVRCYEPVGCTGSLGKDLACESVKEPEKSVYSCEGYRLPTRAEAEYAVRAGTISTFYSGDITVHQDDTICNIDPALELIGWYCFNSEDRPHIGGALKSNGFGLYDMIGNLGEWSNEEQHYKSSPGGTDPRGEVKLNQNRMRVGGQFNHKNYLARTASLLSDPWETHSPATGFRLVRTLDPNPSQD